ncbi:MAG: hypothetical protein IPK99_10585 [Flavobacteriales bacterium]|nr:hypothetical protein [Flavobacteriales bacterium]
MPGCVTLRAIRTQNDSLFEARTYCSSLHLYDDAQLQDSTTAFYAWHSAVTDTILRQNSVFTFQFDYDLSWRDGQRHGATMGVRV